MFYPFHAITDINFPYKNRVFKTENPISNLIAFSFNYALAPDFSIISFSTLAGTCS